VNRKIEFRVWDKLLKKYISINGILVINFDSDDYCFQQYTGFDDLNKKKIYEGDIVELDDGRKKSISWNAVEGYWRVDFEDQDNGFDYDCLAMNGGEWNGPIKVAGNIFETPDLLK